MMRNPSGASGSNRNVKDQKAKDFWGTTKRLLSYLSGRYILLSIVIFLALLSTLFQIVTPKILGKATTEIFQGVVKGMEQIKQGQKVTNFPVDFTTIGKILLIVIVLYVLSSLFGFLQQFIMTRVSQKTVYRLRRDLKEKMNRLPISYYDTHSNGDVMSRAINDMDNIASTLQQSLTQLLTSFLTIIGVFYMMITISWALTLVTLATIPLSLLIVTVIAPKSQKFFSQQQQSLGLLNDQVEENYGAQIIVKSFNHQEEAIANFEIENASLYNSGWKAQFISAIIVPLMNFIKNLGYVFIAIFGGIKVIQGTLSLGNLQAFLQYSNQFSQPITQIAELVNTIQLTIASSERIFEVLDEKEMEDISSGIEPIKNCKDQVIFDHVQFGYEGEQLLMTDFNFQVKEGETIAIVGPTGAGKTTLINLLERFYDVSGGSIKLNGSDIRDIKRETLRANFAMVLQDTWLFTGTILENIRYGNEHATEEEIYAAAQAAHVAEFVKQLPDGYETILNEEASNISQGQRQLITIARAFLADPAILILDEATSSVDTRTEVLIQKAMGRLLQNRTSFVVAHRLSTIRGADNIIVMNQGSIVETGNHDELMSKNGFYADLYNSQFSDNLAI